jgi:23S rRNA (guanine745-N1)-methyltransferase
VGAVIFLVSRARETKKISARRSWPGLAFAVTDLWSDWPVQDAALDLVISIFAPKNFRETARVLRPGGCFALVYPRANHLVELRQRYALMRHKDKAERYAGAVSRMIGPPTAVRLVGRMFLDPAAVRDAVLMVPAARHTTPLALDATTEPMAVTFDVSVLLACKAGSSAGKKR